MSSPFPILSTAHRNLARLYHERAVIWRFGRLPFLATVAWNACGTALYFLVVRGALSSTAASTSEEASPSLLVELGVWAFASIWAPLALAPMIPLIVTWTRLCVAGPATVTDRVAWSITPADIQFAKSAFSLMLQFAGIALAVTFAALIVNYFTFLTIAFGGASKLPSWTATWLFLGPNLLAMACLAVVWVRVSASLIPAACGANTDLGRAWRATAPVRWRLFIIYWMCAAIFVVPGLLLEDLWSNLFDNLDPSPARPLEAVFINGLTYLPFTVLSVLTSIGVLAEVWRRPDGQNEWPELDIRPV